MLVSFTRLYRDARSTEHKSQRCVCVCVCVCVPELIYIYTRGATQNFREFARNNMNAYFKS